MDALEVVEISKVVREDQNMRFLGGVCIFFLAACAVTSSGKKIIYQNEAIEEDEFKEIMSRRPPKFDINMHFGNVSQTNVTSQLFCTSLSSSDSCPSPYAKFYLYTPDGTRTLIDQTDPNWFSKSKFDKSQPTVLLFHGFGGGDNIGSMPLLRRAYLKLNYNVINADWAQLVAGWCYLTATRTNVRGMGKCTAQLLAFFERSTSINYQKVTCVGYSLGAHVCGTTASFLAKKLDKIVGLDPAGPLMQNKINRDKLDSGDATQVQVIHTNADFYGMRGQVGKVDFCINGGLLQTACANQRDYYYCSHVHSICYMAESLFTGKRRTAMPCVNACPYTRIRARAGSNATVGLAVESGASGMYCMYVKNAPYCNDPSDSSYGDPICCDTSISANDLFIQTEFK
ncbi:Hypothetical predicted protein [Cloeon dipterum]|uniref:Lipase domain-containing protein n=1 Tax=Cloeon dipterum TaxID=197152 RepID=A0A8S1D9W5_9INSE|nr:Hypothetical predicted protein [Cloeon dipterum]